MIKGGEKSFMREKEEFKEEQQQKQEEETTLSAENTIFLTKSIPGSLMPGVPASLINATISPSCSLFNTACSL